MSRKLEPAKYVGEEDASTMSIRRCKPSVSEMRCWCNEESEG